MSTYRFRLVENEDGVDGGDWLPADAEHYAEVGPIVVDGKELTAEEWFSLPESDTSNWASFGLILIETCNLGHDHDTGPSVWGFDYFCGCPCGHADKAVECKNCPLPIRWDSDDEVWRHDEHEGITCGSAAYTDADAVAEPAPPKDEALTLQARWRPTGYPYCRDAGNECPQPGTYTLDELVKIDAETGGELAYVARELISEHEAS